jgi:hypothetical protein
MYAESIYICGVTRNCAPHLPRVLENIATIGALFSHFHIIIAVSDDSPADQAILREHTLSASGHLTVIMVPRDPAKPRTVNIARARNAALTTLCELASTGHLHPSVSTPISAPAPAPAHYIMMDCDDVCAQPINLATFMAAYNRRREWDAITFAPTPYYDLWALSSPPFVFSYSNFSGGWRAYMAHITRLLGKTPKGEIVHVWSAFCGFGIYKWAMSEGMYDGRWKMDYIPSPILSRNITAMGGPIRRAPHPSLPFGEPDADCEHRRFHLTAVFKRGARIGIFNGALFGGVDA